MRRIPPDQFLTLPRCCQAVEQPDARDIVAPAPYVRLRLAAQITGYTVKAMEQKIAKGVWIDGREYRRAPDGAILVSIPGYVKWVESGGGGWPKGRR